MRHADSNVLVGLTVPVDYHHASAVALLKRVIRADEGPVIVSEAIVLETLQVLERRYGVRPGVAAGDLRQLLLHEVFEVDSDVLSALEYACIRPALGFVDSLLLARTQSTGVPILTFDNPLQRAVASGSSAP